MLPWNVAKRGLSSTDPIHTLWRFLGSTWLSTTDEDDMLEMLRARIEADPNLVGSVRVESASLSDKLAGVFKERDSVDYEQSPSTRWLGKHTKQKHWVTLEFDGVSLVLRYADSLSDPIPPSLREMLQWWASKHIPDELRFDFLPTAIQTDGHSCGMFASNSAEHAVYPMQTTLMKQEDATLARLSMFNRIANRILDRVFSAFLFLTSARH
ncbi:hypothetical protein B0H10DRAFT_2039733 [Mycena sp. CBHHK59/15]|nr:hypothetical protein B0H10DRAFT_2072324 [Mycena sp. CBHHK59/15]KAJ6612202.1 hypothetical protein B0H10DRAFT_2053343 [Mycena sp. CBHHK59/15]KAJ6615664.1 hypothetical protein B0H10DRAFT_2039733 [Mycena sp. CBHHK59/15]